jgi:hypothetical protein
MQTTESMDAGWEADRNFARARSEAFFGGFSEDRWAFGTMPQPELPRAGSLFRGGQGWARRGLPSRQRAPGRRGGGDLSSVGAGGALPGGGSGRGGDGVSRPLRWPV